MITGMIWKGKGERLEYIGKPGLGGEVRPDVNDYDYSSGCYIYCFRCLGVKGSHLLKVVNSRAFDHHFICFSQLQHLFFLARVLVPLVANL